MKKNKINLIKLFSSLTTGIAVITSIPFLQTSCSCSSSKKEKWVPYIKDEIYNWDTQISTKIATLTNEAKANISEYISDEYNCLAIPNSATEIAGAVFFDNRTNTSYIPSNIKYISLGDPNKEDASKCTNIAAYNFQNVENLISVDFSKAVNLNSLGASLFKGCSKLESIVLPGKITSIKNEAFKDCTKLKSITFDNLNEVVTWDVGDSNPKSQFENLPEGGTIYIRGSASTDDFKNMLVNLCDSAKVFDTWNFKKIK